MSDVSGRRRLGLSLAFLAMMMWAVLPIALVKMMEGLDPITTSFFRFFLTAIVLTVMLSLRRRLPDPSRFLSMKRVFQFLGAGLLLASNYGLFILGLQKTTAEAAEVIIQLAPMLLLLSGIWIFKEQFSRFQWAGLFVFIIGLMFYFSHRSQQILVSNDEYGTGILMLITGAILWAGYAIIQKLLLTEFSSEETLVVFSWIGALLFLTQSELSSLSSLDTSEWLLLTFCGINTLVAYGSFSEALVHSEASRVGAIVCLAPIFTSLIVQSITIDGVDIEPLQVLTVLGAILVVGGSMAVALGNKKLT